MLAEAERLPGVLFWLQVDGKPVPQGRPRVSRHGTYYSRTSTAYRDELVTLYRAAHRGDPIDRPVCLTVKVAGPRKGSDLTNFVKQAEDALVDAGVLADDDWRIVREVHAHHVEGEAEYLEVVIEEVS